MMDPRGVLACLVLAALTLGAQCVPPAPPPEPEPPPPSEPAPYPETCVGVCQRWADLGCEEAEDTPNGATCDDVCQNIMDSGVFEWDLPCMVRVTTCEQIRACER